MAKNVDCACCKAEWRTWLVWLLRIVVGSIFIFSGFVKAIDPWGSIYKFGEYLNSFGLHGFDSLLLFSAVSVSVIEFVLGIFLFLGIYRRVTPVLMLAMMIVMLPLTLYIALTDNVADCGCFGDAVVVSNWASFLKNVVITVALCFLLPYNKGVKNIYGFAVQWMVAMASVAYVIVIAMAGYFYQPLIDFRPFPVGTKIAQNGNNNSGDADGINANYIFTYEKDGVRREFSLDSLPDESWTFVDRELLPSRSLTEDSLHEKSDNMRPVTVIGENYENADSVILDSGEQMLFLFPDLNDVVISFTYLINELYDFSQSHGIDVIGLTSSDNAAIAEWNDLSMASYKMYRMDDSELKMLARGNPAAVYLRDGVIMWKRTLQSISIDKVSTAGDMDDLTSDFEPKRWLYFFTTVYGAFLLLVLIINRTHIIVKFSWRRVRNKSK